MGHAKPVRLIKHETVATCGSFEVGRHPSRYFYWDDTRRLNPDQAEGLGTGKGAPQGRAGQDLDSSTGVNPTNILGETREIRGLAHYSRAFCFYGLTPNHDVGPYRQTRHPLCADLQLHSVGGVGVGLSRAMTQDRQAGSATLNPAAQKPIRRLNELGLRTKK
jgi:hypothetical protein